jgi:hypothetical protein
MKTPLVSDLRQLASIKAGEITTRHVRLLSEAANHIELVEEILRDKERDNDKWRRRTLEAENRLRLRGMALKG